MADERDAPAPGVEWDGIFDAHDRRTGQAGYRRSEPRSSADAERCVIGGVLHQPELLPLARSIVRSADFYMPAHSVAWEALCALADRGAPFDGPSLAAELRHRNGHAVTEGGEMLVRCMSLYRHVRGLESACHIVADYASARAIQQAAQEIALAAQDWSVSVPALRDLATQRIAETATPHDTSDVHHLGDDSLDVCAAIEAGLRGEAPPGIPTGYYDLDDCLKGMDAGQLLVLAARPRVGKTALALSIAANVASRTGPVLFFSLEMTRRELLQRWASAETGVPGSVFRDPRTATREDYAAVTEAFGRLSAIPLRVRDRTPATIGDLCAVARAEHMRRGVRLVVVDYLQLAKPDTERPTNREAEVAEVSRGLKSLAKELSVPVLALAQLNRESARAKRRPGLEDLRESGQIEQDADVVMFLHREELYDPSTKDKGICEVIVPKQRSGASSAVVRLGFRPELTKFVSLTQGTWA